MLISSSAVMVAKVRTCWTSGPNDRYLYGLASYYEVLEAEQRLYPAQNAQAQNRLGRLLAYVQLYKALGGGWNLKDPQVPPSTAAAQEPAACAEKKC